MTGKMSGVYAGNGILRKFDFVTNKLEPPRFVMQVDCEVFLKTGDILEKEFDAEPGVSFVGTVSICIPYLVSNA